MTRPPRADLLLAAAFAVAVVAGSALVAPLDAAGIALLVLAAVVTVGLRRVAPLGALTGSVLVVNTYLLLGHSPGPVLLCLVLAVFAVARRGSLPISALTCGVAAAISSATIMTRVAGAHHSTWLLALAWTGWIVLPWSLGALVHVVETAQERARADLIARAAMEERMRLAGEVHDIAGHAFALITMQAGVALLVLDEEPGQTRRCVEAVREISTTALTDLRRMLDAFHPHQAGLTDLIHQVRAGGLSVTLDHPADLPDSLTVYRIVQEALTNVLRHAGPTTAQVAIARQAGHLQIRVTDHGNATAASVNPPGRGLTGMRHRVEALHGTMTAGPRAGGGFQVLATLPEPAP